MRGLLRRLERRTGMMLKTRVGHVGGKKREGGMLVEDQRKKLGDWSAAGTVLALGRAFW